MEEYKKIIQFIDEQTRMTVGILCKRIEVLEKAKALSASLYKSLVKEILYESSRNLKNIIEVYLKVGSITFKNKPREKE